MCYETVSMFMVFFLFYFLYVIHQTDSQSNINEEEAIKSGPKKVAAAKHLI